MLPERGTFYLEGDQEGTGILENANKDFQNCDHNTIDS